MGSTDSTNAARPERDPEHVPDHAYVELHDTHWSATALPQPFPSGDTLVADQADAVAPHAADRPPTPDEEAAAPTEVDPSVAATYKEAIERGAAVEGEGQI